MNIKRGLWETNCILNFFAQDTTQSKNVIDILESKQMFKRIDL